MVKNFLNLPPVNQLVAGETNVWKVWQMEFFYGKEWKTASCQDPHDKFVSVSPRKHPTQAAASNAHLRQRLKRSRVNKNLVFILQVLVSASFSLPERGGRECVHLHLVCFIVAGRPTPLPPGHRSNVAGTVTRPIKAFQQKLQTFSGFRTLGQHVSGLLCIFPTSLQKCGEKKAFCGSVWPVSTQHSVFVQAKESYWGEVELQFRLCATHTKLKS